MVTSAATAFLNTLCSTIITASSRAAVAAAAAAAGNIESMVLSQSFTSFEMRSVVKKGCSNTFSMKGNLSRPPVRLSYFFKIFARPVMTTTPVKQLRV